MNIIYNTHFMTDSPNECNDELIKTDIYTEEDYTERIWVHSVLIIQA